MVERGASQEKEVADAEFCIGKEPFDTTLGTADPQVERFVALGVARPLLGFGIGVVDDGSEDEADADVGSGRRRRPSPALRPRRAATGRPSFAR
jgi:hypothetical protein